MSLALLALGLCTSPARRAAAASALAQQREFDLLVLLDQQKEREQDIASGAAQRGQEDSVLEAEIRNLKAEIKAIEDNAVYCEQAKKRIDAGEERFLKRVTLRVDDVGVATQALKEGYAMGVLLETPERSLLSYGDEPFGADNGGHFAIELVKASGSNAGVSAGGVSLRHIQLLLAKPLRLSVLDTYKCEFLYTYGWLQTRTAFGLVVNSYVGRRRDPIEQVALTVRDVPAATRALTSLGMEATPTKRGGANEPGAQYRPAPPAGSVSLRWGGDKDTTALLLCPEDREHRVGDGPDLFAGLCALGADGAEAAEGESDAARLLGVALSGVDAFEASL
eukprot:PRCOL_00001032-RA